MPATVIVNNLTIVHAQSGGVAMAFPDVCLTPGPMGPIPIPYPNVAMSAHTTQGSQTVKADGLPFMLKSSSFAMSSGDEPGAAGGGVASGMIKGKALPKMYSFDVKVEGENVFRNTDIMLQNGGPPTNTPPAPVVQPNMLAIPKIAQKGKQPEVTSLAWTKSEVCCGDVLALKVKTKDMPDGKLVIVAEWTGAGTTRGSVLADLKGSSAEPRVSAVRGAWAKNVRVKARHTNPGGAVVESAALEIKAPQPGAREFVRDRRSTPAYSKTKDGRWVKNGKTYSWEYGYEIELKTGEVEVKRKIDFDLQPGANPPGPYHSTWQREIESVWNRKFVFHRKGCSRGMDCACAPANGCCKFILSVKVEFSPEPRLRKVRYFAGGNDPRGWGKVDRWWTANTWWERAVGVPPAVRAHEFAHLIGMYDEYPAGACDPERKFTDVRESIMSAGSTVFARHVEHFRVWAEGKLMDPVGPVIAVVPK